MNNLPYLQPDKDYFYNVGILILIIGKLARTKRKKLVLTIDKLQTFYFLVTRPVFLNRVLELADKRQFFIDESDYYTVDTISLNVDELFNRNKVITLLKTISLKGYIATSFSEKEGFMFELNDKGNSKIAALDEGYFKKINTFIESLANLQSESSSKINSYINVILKQG
jgi:hypothetical protein